MSKRSGNRVRRIAVVTGTRAEYGLLQSTMRAVSKHKRLELQLVVTGMHLLKKFGQTVNDIVHDGWRIDARVPMQRGDDSSLDQAVGLSRGVAGIAEFLHSADSDVVVVLGDRIEALAGALAAVTTHRILAHIHGGDLAQGDLDDSLRHAITKLAHVHLAATKSSARRIIRMGESRERVHVVGAPGLDDLGALVEEYRRRKSHRVGRPGTDFGNTAQTEGLFHNLIKSQEKPAPSRSRFCFDTAPKPRSSGGRIAQGEACGSGERIARGEASGSGGAVTKDRACGAALILHHACGRSAEREYLTMRTILETVAKAGLRRTIIYPNSDAGHDGIIRAIDGHVAKGGASHVEVVRSLDRDRYLRRLIEADVLVGNSSSGIIEAATAGTPVVNVGSRQAGRERSGRAVVDSDETRGSIARALNRALRMRPKMGGRSAYGDGRAGEQIARILSVIPVDESFRRKKNAY